MEAGVRRPELGRGCEGGEAGTQEESQGQEGQGLGLTFCLGTRVEG